MGFDGAITTHSAVSSIAVESGCQLGFTDTVEPHVRDGHAMVQLDEVLLERHVDPPSTNVTTVETVWSVIGTQSLRVRPTPRRSPP